MFSHLRILFEFAGASAAAHKKFVRDNGADVAYLVTARTSYVIVNKDDSGHDFLLEKASAHGVPVVDVQWLAACQKANRLVDSSLYRVHSQSATHDSGNRPADNLGVLVLPPAVVRRPAQLDPAALAAIVAVPYAPQRQQQQQLESAFPESRYEVIRCDVFYGPAQAFQCLELHVGEATGGGFVFRVFVQSSTLASPDGGTKVLHALPDVDVAELYYAMRFFELNSDSKWKRVHLLNFAIGSERTKESGLAFIGAAGATGSPLDPVVARLVDDLYGEAVGRLNSVVRFAVDGSTLGTLSIQQVQSAEAVLLEISHALRQPTTTASVDAAGRALAIQKLSDEFNTMLPLRDASPIATVADVEQREELLELMKSLLCVGEAGGAALHGSQAEVRYRALGCRIAHIAPDSAEFVRVRDALLSSQSSSSSASSSSRANVAEVVNIFSITRRAERDTFAASLPNARTLYHGSRASSWVGILAKGLMPPLIHGEGRRDYGLLGAGIYFASDAASNVQYTSLVQRRGTRFLLSCTVALGNVQQLRSGLLLLCLIGVFVVLVCLFRFQGMIRSLVCVWSVVQVHQRVPGTGVGASRLPFCARRGQAHTPRVAIRR